VDNIRREETPVSQLGVGMFVAELDRPWLGTPFMLEGLLIEDHEQIALIASLCKFVYVDRTVSVGAYFIAPPKENVAIKRDSPNNRINIGASLNTKPSNENVKTQKSNATNPKFSFFDVLTETQLGNQNPGSTAKDAANSLVFHTQYSTNDTQPSQPLPSERDDNPSLASQIKSDFSNFISGLTSWGGKQKKLKTLLDTALTKKLKERNAAQPAVLDETPLVEEEIAHILPVYEQTQSATREMFEALALGQEIDLTSINEALDSMVSSIERNPDALIWLAKLKLTDDYAYNHALNVSVTLMALASFMSLPKKQVKDLGLAGLLQDIGKGKISADLLHKQEKITAEEFATLKKHVDYALELLEVTDNISSTVILTVTQHHERIDGSGYPYQLAGKQISLMGQMAGLIDTYCALTTNKVYAKGVYNQMALEEIHKLRDVKFNGALIDQLVQFLGMYPVSSLVELNSGEVGVVIQQNTVRRLLPRVMLLLNPDKTKNDYPAVINLINAPLTPAGEPYEILRGLSPDSYGLNSHHYYA